MTSCASPFPERCTIPREVRSEPVRATPRHDRSGLASNGRLTDFTEISGIRGDEPGLENVKTLTGRDFPVVGGSGRDPDSRVRFPLALPTNARFHGRFIIELRAVLGGKRFAPHSAGDLGQNDRLCLRNVARRNEEG